MDVTTKLTRLGLFNFRALLNIGFLLRESEKARELRGLVLNMVLVADNKLSKEQLRVLIKDIVDFGELSESSKLEILSAASYASMNDVN